MGDVRVRPSLPGGGGGGVWAIGSPSRVCETIEIREVSMVKRTTVGTGRGIGISQLFGSGLQ